MTEISEKSGSVNSDKVSIETRIINHKFHHDDGDGPQISYPFCDMNQISMHEFNIDDQKIEPRKLESERKSTNDCDESSTPGNQVTSLNKSKNDSNEILLLKCRFSNKTFSLSSLNNLAITEIFKNVQSTVDELQLSNSSIKKKISMDLEKIGSYMLTYEYNRQIHPSTVVSNNLNDAQIQRLQVLLLYVVEQLNHLNGTIVDTQKQIEEILTFKLEAMENNKINSMDKLNSNNGHFKMNNKQSEEEDIFSVEELSWDEHQFPNLKSNNRNKVENCMELKTSDIENTKVKSRTITSSVCQDQLIDHIKPNMIINNNEESIDERSIKTKPSKPITPQLTDSIVIEKFMDRNLEKSNSFQEIKSKFENLRFSPQLSDKKDLSVSPSFKGEKEIMSIKRSSANVINSKKSRIDQENLSKKHDDDCVDNSAFLVSSIDSYTESISFTNPNNNNNRFSDKYKPNISNIIENKEINPSLDVDFVAEKVCSQTESIKDGNKSNMSYKIDQYIEVVNNVNVSNDHVYIDSPYINYQNEKGQNSKSSDSSTENIIAVGKLVTRFQKSIQNSEKIDQEYCPVYEYMKELVDSEKNYVNGLFIYSQILYNRIKVSNVISHRNLSIMFPSCIHCIYKFHVDFCSQLNNVFQKTLNIELLKTTNKEKFEENKFQTVKFGQIFLENLENDNWKFFTLYRQFYWKSQLAVAMFDKLKKNSPKFERLIKILQHNEHCNNLELSSFIALPVKRLPTYLSMLRKILDKLSSTEMDEKIPMLAVEHLLDSFIKEMDNKQQHLIFKKNFSKTTESSSESSNNSSKHHAATELQTQGKSLPYDDKHESLLRAMNSKSIKQLLSQSALMNDFLKGSTNNLNSETQCGSISIDKHSNKERLYLPNSLGRSYVSQPRCTSTKLKDHQIEYHKFQIDGFKQIKDSKSVGDYNLKISTNHQRIQLNETVLLRPQSVPLRMKSTKTENYPSCVTNQFDTESLHSQITDECSVCLNSQDEFEIDTSIEEDDKTCTAENQARVKDKDRSNTTSHNNSLSPQNSINSHLIEFCSNSKIKYNPLDFNEPQSIKLFLSDQNKFSIINNLLFSETDLLIHRKVENVVLILCHVLIETMKEKRRISNYSIDIVESHKNKNSPRLLKDQVEIDNLRKSESPMEYLINCTNEKKENKKFSIKQLFSIRRKSSIKESV